MVYQALLYAHWVSPHLKAIASTPSSRSALVSCCLFGRLGRLAAVLAAGGDLGSSTLARRQLGGAVGAALGRGKFKVGDQTALGVGPGVDEVGVIERQLDGTAVDRVDGLDTKHKGVVLVADLVPPAAEAATGQDIHALKLGQQLLEHALTLQRGSGVAMVEGAVVGGDDLVFGLDHLGVDQALDAVPENVGDIDGLHRRLRDLQHDGPVGALLGLGRGGLGAVSKVQSRQRGVLLRLVEGRVVGEDGGSVEVAVVLGKVQL